MKIHNVRITMVWMLVMSLSLIFFAGAGQTTDANKDADKMASAHIEKQKSADESKSQAASTPVSSKIYVENPVKGTGQAAIFGEATAISAIGYDIVNYGGYFTAAGVRGRGVYGEALYSGDYQNFGGYFRASGEEGVGVYGESIGRNGVGVYGKAMVHDSVAVKGEGADYDFYAGGSGNYYPFTGAHEVKLSGDMPEEELTGMIVSATGQTEYKTNDQGNINISATLPTVTLSSKADDKAVFGVMVKKGPLPSGHWYKAKEGERFGGVNALGEGRVWVTNCNGNIETGDYITTSGIPGYGQMQDDDLLHSYTLGKAIETIDWDHVAETVQYGGKTYKRYLLAVVYTSG